MLEYLAEELKTRFADVVLEDHFVTGGPGHTRAVSTCERTHNGRDTAAWYTVGRILGLLSDEEGAGMVRAIESLQDRDEASPFFGCMRWYAEETFINDSNAAFFVQMPLAAALLAAPEVIPAEEREGILRILRRGGRWFAHETVHGPIHYTNKILADGGMTLAVARLTDDDALYAAGLRFFKRFLAYTHDEGWGWGENISLGYNGVILTMLRLASAALKAEDAGLRDRIEALIRSQLAHFRFFEGHEPVPGIRSYNFGGIDEMPCIVYNLAGVPGSGLDALRPDAWSAATACLLFDGELYRTDAELTEWQPLPAPRTRVTRVFHENEAYSWIGRGGSLGTLNNFPVFPDCYQHKTWGLGWQSMPVSADVYGACTSYLRWVVRTADGERIHPRSAFLSPAVFAEDDPYPSIRTRCSQRDNAAIVFRMMEGVDNDAFSICDEWYIPTGTEKPGMGPRAIPGGDWLPAAGAEIRREGDWICVVFPHASLLLRPLAGGQVETRWDENGACRLSVTCAQSEAGHIVCPELASGWAVVFYDGEAAGVGDFAASLTVEERYTRAPRFTASVTVRRGGEVLVSRDIDIAEESTR